MLKNCVNVKSTEFQDLLEESKLDVISLASKISHWQDINGVDNYPTLEQLNILPSDVKPNQVQYQLKLINALQKINRKEFTSDKLQGWINDLKKQGVTDQQIDIFKQYAKPGMSRDEILIDIYSNFGFNIEINTSTIPKSLYGSEFILNGFIYGQDIDGTYHKESTSNFTDTRQYTIISQEEYEEAYNKSEEIPTHHFSNLSVSGVVNYKEKAIITPEIENIASEHIEDFNQGKQTMIGWIREGEHLQSFDKSNFTINGQEFKIENNKYLYKGTLDTEFKELTKEVYEGQYKAYLSIGKEGIKNSNTKIILEIQSGIFQDFRDKKDLTGNSENYYNKIGDEIDTATHKYYIRNNKYYIWDKSQDTKEVTKEVYYNAINIVIDYYENKQDNQFLQLLNKDNNWVRFFIKTTIQDAVKNGYKKIWFPQGETAARIEGHQVIADRLADIDKKINQASDTEVSSIYRYGVSIMYLHKNDCFSKDGPAVWTTNIQDITNKDILSSDITYNKHGVEFTYLKEGIIDHSEFIKSKETHIKELEQEKQELKSQGIAKLAPIEHFYGNTIYNILKKNYIVTPITDEYNNGWYEVELNEERDKEDILLNLTPEKNVNNIVLNSEQQEAVNKTIDFIKNGNSNEWFLIEGKAGTGKTTIVDSIIKAFPGKSVKIAALSHKAKSVIRSKVKNHGMVSFYSLAGLIGQKLDLESGRFEKNENDFNFPPISEADIIIIDEASMINEQALELIYENKTPSSKVIFIGDIGQLPPIRTTENPYYKNKTDLFSKKSPVFNTNNKIKLLTRVRQGEESPILPFADYFWNNSQIANPEVNPVKEPRVNKVTDNGNLLFVNSFVSIQNKVVSTFKKAIEEKNPNYVKVVTYRNATREGVNKFIHNSIFGSDSKHFNNGELIIFNDNFNDIENATETQIDDSSDIKTDNNQLKYIDIKFTYNDEIREVPVILPESKKAWQDLVSKQFSHAFSLKGTSQYRQELAKAWSLKNKFANVDYGYAITSHKSQGSTYDIVIVDEKDINSVGALSNKEKSESIYTALTRAKNTAVIISSESVEYDALPTIEKSIEKPIIKESISQPISQLTNHSMYYKMPAKDNLTGKDTSTLDLAEQGLRTATTRSYPLGKVGDIIIFENKPQQYQITEVEQLTSDKVSNNEWITKWSNKEQWTPEYFKSILGGKTVHIGSWQTTFKKVNTPSNSNINNSTDEKNHIKIYSKAKSELGRELSNFAHTPFIYNELEFASVEAWWHWYKLSNAKMTGLFKDMNVVSEEELDHLRTLDGPDVYRNGEIISLGAKSEGSRLAKKYEGLAMASPNKAVLKPIYLLKLANSARLKDMLVNSTLPFYHYIDSIGDYTNTHYQWTADLWDEIRAELKGEITSKTQVSNVSMKGEFEDIGKGTKEGDGKDKAMREIADSFVGEVINKDSSSYTSAVEIGSKSGVTPLTQGNTITVLSGDVRVVMLARNGELKNKPLSDITKASILRQHNKNAEFVVGDMPGVDSQFIDYLTEIGAKFTIYHTGTISRIQLPNTILPTINISDNLPIVPPEQLKLETPTKPTPTIVRPTYNIETLKSKFSSYISQGFDTAGQQDSVINSILYQIKKEYFKNNKLNVVEAHDKIKSLFQSDFDNNKVHLDYVNENGFEYDQEGLDDLANNLIYNAEDLQKRNDNLQVVLNNFDQLYQRALLRLDEIGLNVKGDIALTNEDGIYIESEDIVGEEAIFEKIKYNDKARFEINPKSTSSFKFKMWLSTIPNFELIDGKYRVKKNYLGHYTYVDMDNLYNNLLLKLADTEVILGEKQANGHYTGLLGQIKKLAKNHYEYQIIFNDLINPENSELATEFVNAMSNHYHTRFSSYNTKKYNKDREVIGRETRFLDSNTFSGYKGVIDIWFEYQKSLPIVKEDNGALIIDIDEVHKIRNEWNDYIRDFDKHWEDTKSNKEIRRYPDYQSFFNSEETKLKFQSIMNKLGIKLQMDTIDDAFENSSTIFTGELGKSLRLENSKGTETSDSFISYIFNAFEPKEIKDDVTDEGEPLSRLEYNNPLYGPQSERTIRNLATLEYINSGETSDLGTINGKGDLEYNISQYTYIANVIRKLRQPNSKYLKQIKNTLIAKSTKNAKGSKIIEDLESNPEYKKQFKIIYFDASRERNRNREYKSREDMDKSDQTNDAITAFYNNNSKIGWYFMMTHYNNTLAPMIPVVKTNFKLQFDKETFNIPNEALDAVMRQVMAEVHRIEATQEMGDTIFPDYDIAAHYFLMFPYLNPSVLSQLVEAGKLTQEEMDSIWTPKEDGDEFFKLNTSKTGLNTIRKIVNNVVLNGINDTINEWLEFGILKQNQNGTLTSDQIDINYIKQIESVDHSVKNIAAEFYVNTLIAYTEMYRVIYGDPAIYAKVGEDIDKNGIVNQQATEAFMQKRFKGAISPHMIGNWKKQSYNRITINDRKIDLEIESYLKHLDKDAYHKINTTDGLEYTTTREAIEAKRAYGKISDKEADKLIAKIDKAYSLDPSDPKYGYYKFEDNEISIILGQNKFKSFTPYFHEEYKMMMIDFTKSSDIPILAQLTGNIPILPQFANNMELDRLRRFMEENDIDRASSASADKMGTIKTFPFWNSSNGGLNPSLDILIETFKSDRNSFVRTLSREDMGMQQELPQGKKEIAVSTQLDGHLFLNARNLEGFKYKGKSDWTGKDLERAKMDINISLMKLGKDQVEKDLGISYDATGKMLITDLNKVKTLLEEEANRRHWITQDIKGLTLVDGELMVPMFFNNSDKRIQALLLSIITNNIIKHKQPGTGFTQIPQAGLRPTNIVTKDEINLKDYGIVFTDSYNIEKGLQPIGEVEAAQVFVTWDFKDPQGNDLLMSDFINKETGRIDPKKLPKNVLQLISFRIPGQGHNSGLPIEIVGFIPKESKYGDVIVVPDTITKQMGSDFDIDKLYSYITAYYYNKIDKTINKIHDQDEIYKNNTKDDLTVKLQDISDKLNKISKVKLNINTILTSVKYEKVSKEYDVDDMLSLIRSGEAVDNTELQEALDDIKNMIEDEKDLKEELKDLNNTVRLLEEERFEVETKLEILDQFTPESLLKQDYKDIHWAVFTHPGMLKYIINPLENEDLATEQERIVRPTQHYINTFTYQRDSYIEQIQSADQIAPFALSLKLHSLIENIPVNYYAKNAKGKWVPAKFTGFKKNGAKESLELTKFNGEGISYFDDKKDKAHTRTVHDNINIQLSGAVDSKNQSNVGINKHTTPVSIIISIFQTANNEALDFRYNTRFLSQQAIKIYCYYIDANLRNTSEDYFPNMKEVKTDAYLKAKEYIEKYISNHEYEQTDDYKKMSFSPDDMLKMININAGQGDRTEDYYIAQSKILDLYRELDYIADVYIAKRKAILSPMSNGPGINFASANKLQELVSNIDKNKTLNGIEKTLNNTDSGFAAHEILDFAVELGNVLNPELKVFSDIVRAYEYVTGEDELSDKAISTLLTRYKQSFYSGRADLYGVNDVNFERARLLFNAADNVSHARMIEAYNEETKYSNKYTSKLRVKKAKEAGKPDTLRFNELRGVNVREEQLVSTIDMLIDPNQKIRELMQDNAEAAYILGNVNGIGSFNKNIPIEYLEEIGFNKALRNIHKDLINKRNEADIEIFIRDLFKHEPWRGKPLNPKFINKSLSSIKVGNFPAVFTLKSVAEVPEVSQIMITRENHVFYPEFINFYNEHTNTWLLFEKIGTFSGSPVYQVTDTKGEANAKKTGVYEFDYNGSPYSIFKENQVPQIKDVIPLDNQEIEIRHTQAVEDDEIMDDVPDLDEEVYNITQGSLAGMIEDKFNNMSNDGKSSYITILRNLQGSPYDNLLSEIIQRKLTEQGATFKGEIDRNLNTSAKTLFKGNVVKGIKFNPSKILNEFHRQQFPNTNDYLNASLNANILHEGTHAILIPITRSKEANSSKVNAILSSLERVKEQTINELEKKYPGLKEDIKLFQQAVEKAKEGTLSNEDLNNISNPMAYYLSNLDEFMVGVLNNRQLQRELNDIIVGEKSLLEKFIDYLSTLFEYLAEELGIKINDNSALRVAIENVIALQDLPIVDNTEEQELLEEMNNIYAETEIRPEHKALIERLNTNIRILNDKYTGALKPEERLDIEQEIQRLEQSRDYILEQQDAETIKKAGIIQLKYADFISLKQNATLRELYNVWQIADTWKLENTKEFMADEIFNDLSNDHRKVFGLLSSRAEVIENRVLDKLTAYFANETSNRRRVNISYSPEELQQIINDPNAREGLELTFALKSGEFKPFINGNPIDTFKSITTGTFETNPEILKKTKAIGFWQAMALSTDINDNPIGQTVVSYIDGAARNKDEMIEEEYKEFDKQLEKIKNPTVAAKIGKNYHIFRQLDGKDYNGRLISSYSSLWHHLLDIDREEINKAKFANEHSGTSTTKENLANAWKQFYAKRRKASITIDLRFFFRPNFKTSNEGYKFNSQKEYITYLEKEFGKEIAEEHILEAKNRYAKYQQELDYQTKAVEANDGISNKQGHIDKWRMENDPLLALDIIYGKEGISNEQIVNNKSEWTLNVARRFHLDGTPTGYYDQNYEIIMSDPDLREFYKYYINTTNRMLKFLPEAVTKYRPQNLLAHVQKELHEIASERGMIGAFKYTGKKGFDSLGSKEVSLLRYVNNPRGIPTYPNGDPYQKLPYYFMETPPKGGTPLSDKARQQYFEEQSEDLEVILKELIKMAYTFDYKNQVQDIARVGLRLHKQAGEIVVDNEGRTRLDSMKRVLGLKKTNTASYEQLKYYVDAMLYDQRKDKGKQSNIKLGVAWTKEARQNKKRELELESLRDKLEEELMNDLITVEQYESKMSAYEEEYKLIARKNLVWGKAGDKTLTYTQLKGLGLNLNSGFANLGFGLITNMTHANGRVDFDNKSLMKAFTMMFSVMKWKSVQGKKITKMIHNYRILFDMDESRYGEDKKLIVKMWNKKLDPYVFQTKTEFYNQGLTFLSYMMHHKIMSKNGEISLFDAYDNNGDWRTELFDDDTNQKWNSKINATTMNDYTITRNRVIQLNKALHGNYDPSSPIQGKKYLLGRALSQFRSWIPEGVESRFGEFRWDDRIGRYREGRYKTFAHLGLINSLKTLGKQIIKSDEAFVHSNGKKFMPWEIENMRRNLAEIGMAATMASVALLLKLMLNYLDDDDDPNSSAEEKAIIYFINILQRVQADISFYLNPNTFTSIIDNPIAAIKTYKDFRNAMVGTYKHLTDSEYQGEPSLVKWSKAFPYTNQVPKFMYLTERRMAF